jgi:hypothetical protein
MTELDRLLQDLVTQTDAWSKSIFWFNSPKDESRTYLDARDSSSDTSTIPFRVIPFHNLPTAALSSLYDTTNIVTLSLFSILSPQERYERYILLHAESILSASEFINANKGPESVRGSIMSLFPLKMVSLWSPSLQQRNQAAEIITTLECSVQLDSVISNGFFEDLAVYIRHQKGARQQWPHVKQ